MGVAVVRDSQEEGAAARNPVLARVVVRVEGKAAAAAEGKADS